MAVRKRHGELLALPYTQIERGRLSLDSAAALPTAQADGSVRQKAMANRMALGLSVIWFADSVSRQLLKVFYPSMHKRCFLRNTTTYACKRVRMVKALVHASPPNAPTAGDIVITRQFGFTTWLARLQFAIPTVFANEILTGLLQLDDLPAGLVVHVRHSRSVICDVSSAGRNFGIVLWSVSRALHNIKTAFEYYLESPKWNERCFPYRFMRQWKGEV